MVSSATLDATGFLEYFQEETPQSATIVSLEGRLFPVQVAYLEQPTHDYVLKAAEVAISIHRHQGLGDILMFLTGREEIERCIEILSDMLPT